MSKTEIHGSCDAAFESVRRVFEENFHARDEIGAAVALVVDGRPRVDLWGGSADQARTQPWQRDTLVNVYSTTKGLFAAAVAALVEQGRLGYDDAVVRHWPEFGAAGKGRTTFAQLLSHQAGLTGFEHIEYLSVVFKRMTGESPGQYRKRTRLHRP